MLTALKVRLYPNKEQQIALAKNFGCCRFVWNFYLNKTNDRDGNATKNLREEGIKILSTNTDGQSEFQAWGEDVSLVSNSTKKRSSMKQESPVIALA